MGFQQTKSRQQAECKETQNSLQEEEFISWAQQLADKILH